jgi:2'-5' RNA ligase
VVQAGQRHRPPVLDRVDAAQRSAEPPEEPVAGRSSPASTPRPSFLVRSGSGGHDDGVTQSVELLLDPTSEAAVLREWAGLGEAGLPSEQRVVPSPTHRPHVTLWAGPLVPPEVDTALPALVAGLDLTLLLGSLLVFGPRRGQVVLVRQVVASAALLHLQTRVAERCGVEPDSHVAPGRWSPHVTLARRVPVERLGEVVATLGQVPDLTATVRVCRRWDGDAKVAWDLT